MCIRDSFSLFWTQCTTDLARWHRWPRVGPSPLCRRAVVFVQHVQELHLLSYTLIPSTIQQWSRGVKALTSLQWAQVKGAWLGSCPTKGVAKEDAQHAYLLHKIKMILMLCWIFITGARNRGKGGTLPRDWNCWLGRLHHIWLRTTESDLVPLNIGLATAYHRAQNLKPGTCSEGRQRWISDKPHEDNDVKKHTATHTKHRKQAKKVCTKKL